MRTLPQLRDLLLEVRDHLIYGRHECALALLNKTVAPGEDSSARSSGTPGAAVIITDLDAEVVDDRGVNHGSVRDLVEAVRVWSDGSLYTTLELVQGVLYNRGINPVYGPEMVAGGHDDPRLYGKLVQQIVNDALAGSSAT